MTPVHRHQLAYLSPRGWRAIVDRAWEAGMRSCLEHWCAHRLPLVVSRQTPADLAAGMVALGLAAPRRWDRQRIALQVPMSEVLYFDEFPSADRITALLPIRARAAWRQLCACLKPTGVTARAYGSYGWKVLSGLDHVHPGSDIDLWTAVSGPAQADAAASVLHGFESCRLRLDGELVFPGDAAVAWREWLAWRAGRAAGCLVKTLTGATVARTLEGMDRASRRTVIGAMS